MDWCAVVNVGISKERDVVLWQVSAVLTYGETKPIRHPGEQTYVFAASLWKIDWVLDVL